MAHPPDSPHTPGSHPREPDDSLDPEPDIRGGDDEGVRLGGLVPDLIRKAVVAGLGAVFMTEEGIRNLAGQLKLPKEVLSYIIAQADKTKGDLTRVIGDELRRFLNSELLRQELLKMLTGVTVEITAEVKLRPDPNAPHKISPTVDLVGSRVKGKHNRSRKEEERDASDKEESPKGSR